MAYNFYINNSSSNNYVKPGDLLKVIHSASSGADIVPYFSQLLKVVSTGIDGIKVEWLEDQFAPKSTAAAMVPSELEKANALNNGA